MKTNTTHYLQKILYLLFISLSIAACSKDKGEDGPIIDAKNELEYNGQTYSLNYGGLGNYGYDGEHTNYEFHMFTFISEDDSLIPIYLFLDVYSPNESGFKGGTFHYADDDEDVEGKYYFDDGYLIRNMNIADETAEELVYVKGGTVNISGEGSQYKLEFDLIMDNDKTIKGSYGGSFESLSTTNAVNRNQAVNVLKRLTLSKSKK